MEHIIFHIDVNNAFLSWEAHYRITELNETTDLRTIPSAIGGSRESRHGIILAKSMPARAYGVKTAETIGDAQKKCPCLTIVPPQMHIYKQYSKKLITLLHSVSPVIEQYSIDEAFVDMTGCPALLKTNPVTAAEKLREHIFNTLGFTVNIGVSTNKLLAKMASDFEKPNKVHRLFPNEINEKMWQLDVNKLFFVGQSTNKRLFNLGIRTIGDLAKSDRNIIYSHLGKHGLLIHDYANGIDTSPVNTKRRENKCYGNSTTLSRDVTDSFAAKGYLLSLCESVGKRLQQDKVLASVISVTLRNYDFSQGSHQCMLPSPTNISGELYKHACRLFDEYWDGSPIRLIGIQTSKITSDSMRQLNLLDQDNFIKQETLDTTIYDIRKKFGDSAI